MVRTLIPLGLVLALEQAASAGAGCSSRLFEVERSKNANVVVYDACLQGSSYDSREPVTAYWLMKAEKGQRQELNLIERIKAYGFKTEAGPSGVRMTMKALKQRPARLVVAGGAPRAVVSIKGRDAFMERVYIKTHEGSDTDVEFIELSGRDIGDGEVLSERLSPR